jgi:hypothetical protein
MVESAILARGYLYQTPGFDAMPRRLAAFLLRERAAAGGSAALPRPSLALCQRF